MMASASRTRVRKQAQAKPEKDPNTIDQQEAELAAAQENAEYQQAQTQYLLNRVGVLRVQINRLEQENAELKAASEASQAT